MHQNAFSRICLYTATLFAIIVVLASTSPTATAAAISYDDYVSDTIPSSPFVLFQSQSTHLSAKEQTQAGLTLVRLNGTFGLTSNESPPPTQLDAIPGVIIVGQNTEIGTGLSYRGIVANPLVSGLGANVINNGLTGLHIVSLSGIVGQSLQGFIELPVIIDQSESDTASFSQESFLDNQIVEMLEWSVVRDILPINEPIQVIDVRTLRIYDIKCSSYYDHADVEPVTQEDTDIMYDIRDGIRSWDARPVWVMIDGKLIAASLHGMPHGGYTVSGNGMNGHLCLHFKGSTTSSPSAEYKSDLQNAVQEAWETYLSILRSVQMNNLLEE